MSKIKYPHLFSSGKIGQVEIKNRVVMPSMGTNMSDGGFVNDAIINHYTERAKGGVGLIMTEVTCVDTPLGLNTMNMLVADDDKYISGLTRLADSIHKAGAKCFLQISHTGRGARRKNIHAQPVGPSAVAMPFSFMMGYDNEKPRALTIEEIREIEDKYAAAAVRAKKAGFDGVELHACGYYMGQQFLSSTANIRTDEYGGSAENRSRFYTEIIGKVRKLCGNDFGLVVKVAVFEMGDSGGITMDEGKFYCNKFLTSGADAIEVMGGSWKTQPDLDDIPSTGSPAGRSLGLCGMIKHSVTEMPGEKNAPVFIGGGRSYEPELVENALAKGLCDFVFMGHGLIVEPHLVNLIEQNRYSEARPCIGCSICTDDQLSYERSIHCTGNPVAGNGANDYTIPPATNIKNVLVVGGGVGGVEAARIAAIRGHKVTLVEKTDKLGGQLTYVVIPPNKQNVVPMFDYLNKQVEVHNVEVLYNTEATEEFILAQNPDVVIWAAGVIPHIIPIKGYEKPSVCSAKQALDGMPLGETVVIIGGVVGCETAELLASQGKKVHIVEMLDEIAGKMAATNRSILLGRLKGYGVQIHLSCACKEITDKGIIMEDKDGTVSEIQCDNVIISVGDKPNNELYKRISKKVKEAYCIGDSNEPGSIAIAVSQGYYTALKI